MWWQQLCFHFNHEFIQFLQIFHYNYRFILYCVLSKTEICIFNPVDHRNIDMLFIFLTISLRFNLKYILPVEIVFRANECLWLIKYTLRYDILLSIFLFIQCSFKSTSFYTISRFLQHDRSSPLGSEEQIITKLPHRFFSLNMAVLNSMLNKPYIKGLTAEFP